MVLWGFFCIFEHCIEMSFASFLSGGFIIAIVCSKSTGKGNSQNAPLCTDVRLILLLLHCVVELFLEH